MRHAGVLLGLTSLALLSPFARGQTPRVLIEEGDAIIGVGGVTRITYIAIEDSGTWLGVFDSEPRIACLLRNGLLTLREGMNLPAPPGTTLGDWGSIDMAENGDLGMTLEVRSEMDTSDGLYWNLSLVALAGPIDLPPFGPGSTLNAVPVVRVTSDGTLLSLFRVRNPAVSTTRDVDALVRFRVDRQGHVLEHEVLATKNTFNEVLGTAIDTLGSLTVPEHSLAMNRHGDFVLPVSGIGRRVLMKNLDTVVAEELAPSPVPGRPWNSNAFVGSRVALNDHGDLVFSGNLTPIGGNSMEPTNLLVVKNGVKFVQSGDVIPALSPSILGKNNPRLALSNRGDVFWRAQPLEGTAGAAFMINHTPLIQENVTVVEGNRVNAVTGGDDCFAISPEGRFLLGRVELQTVGDAVLYVDFGLITEVPGCSGRNQGTLRHLSGAARVGQEIQVGLDDGPFPGALPVLFFSRNSGRNAAGCGQLIPLGELLLAPPFSDFFLLPEWDGANPSVLTIAVPSSMALVDATFHLQGLFGNPNQPASFRLTSGIEYQLGPP